MRLHHLTLSAFGPFPGAEEIDFDELCAAGLFLLTGPTGAGKTTVLDAVCFALYGTVPGVRGVKTLKSQHAPDEARPEVILDFSVRGRRFVVRRSPEWVRPKRRGEGFTTENATATLLETTTGEDHLLSSRAQEVGHLIGELVGMQSTQFVQVAMLPQGGFQKFLRASSQERHDVLQHLFRTDRFSRIEEWVHDHSRALRETSTAGETSVQRVLDAVADRAGADLPPELTADGLRAPEATETALTWTRAQLDTAAEAHATQRRHHDDRSAACAEVRTRHQEAERVRDLVGRRDDARAVLDELAQEAEQAARAAQRLDADARATRCLPLLRMLDSAESEHRAARSAAEQALVLLRGPAEHALVERALPDQPTAEAIEELDDAVRATTARLEALLPREKELRRLRGDLRDRQAALDEAGQAHADAAGRAEGIPAALKEAQAIAAELATSAQRGDALVVELRQARRSAEAARDAERCAAALVGLREDQRSARDRAADARERVQELTARRLAGIAAELAGQLVDGQSCQVCGSTEHPQKAEAATDAVTEEAQATAEADHDTLRAAHAQAGNEVAKAEERLEALREAAGHQTSADAEAHVGTLAARLHDAEHAAARLREAEQTIADLTHEQQELASTLHELSTQVATGSQAVSGLRSSIAGLEEELACALGNEGSEVPTTDGTSPLADRLDRLGALHTALVSALEAQRRQDEAWTRVAELGVTTEEAATEHGFADLEELRSCVLEELTRDRLSQSLETRNQRAARAEAVLEDEQVRGLGDRGLPDIEELGRELSTAQEQEALTARDLHRCEETLTALRRHQERLAQAVALWAPQREEYLRAESMAKLVRGMGADNQLQMRLSAYVLATRLDQVIAAANERLGHMRDQRYLLQRTGRSARKGSQAGLGLEVVDQWTGDVRDPATLSGGETFMVSLALALGLADVVTHEAGGTEIETLFVDEGFGTLDADTLDDVMDRLDELRAGGRAVGVVSHVSELRNRIPTQLHVDKTRSGSTVALRTLVG